jgi:hypothetical protein
MDPLGTSRNEQTSLLVLNHSLYRPGEANHLSSYSPSTSQRPRPPHAAHPLRLTFVLAACVRLPPQSTNYIILATNNMQHRAPLNHYQQRPCCWPQLTDAVLLSLHCLRMSAANRCHQSSPISPAPSVQPHHPLSFITQSTFSVTTRRRHLPRRLSFSFIHQHQRRHISIIASAFLIDLSTA